MAREIVTGFPSGYTLYAIIRNLTGQVWYPAGQAFETWGQGSRTAADYDIPLTYYSGGLYMGDFDANIPDGSYYVATYVQAGASPADSDSPTSAPARRYWYEGTLYQDDTISSDTISAESEEEETETGEGTVTSVSIETRVRQITGRSNTTLLTSNTIATYTYEAAREISKRLLCLKSTASGTLSADGNTITAPSDMVDSEAAIDELYLDSTLLDPITFDEWRDGHRDGYAYVNGTIYVNPTSNNNRSYTLYYSKYHPTTVSTLSLNDDLKMAVVYLVCHKIYDDYEYEDKANRMMQKFEFELAKHASASMAVVKIRQFARE